QISAAQFLDGPTPDCLKRRTGATEEAQRSSRSSISFEQVAHRHLVQFLQSRLERLIFVLNLVHVSLHVEQRQFPPGTFGQKIDLALVERQLGEYGPAVEVVLGVELSADE